MEYLEDGNDLFLTSNDSDRLVITLTGLALAGAVILLELGEDGDGDLVHMGGVRVVRGLVRLWVWVGVRTHHGAGAHHVRVVVAVRTHLVHWHVGAHHRLARAHHGSHVGAHHWHVGADPRAVLRGGVTSHWHVHRDWVAHWDGDHDRLGH